MLQSSLTLQQCVGVSCRSTPPTPGWQWDTMRQRQEGCHGCVTGRHIPTVSEALTPPKFPTSNSPSPAAAIRVGYRAGTASSPPLCKVLGVSCWRGPKSSQMLCQEPQTLVTSLILGRGLDEGSQLFQGDTPPHSGKLGSHGYKPIGPAGAGKQSWSSWCFLGACGSECPTIMLSRLLRLPGLCLCPAKPRGHRSPSFPGCRESPPPWSHQPRVPVKGSRPAGSTNPSAGPRCPLAEVCRVNF